MSGIQYPTSQAFWGKEANIRDDASTIAGTFKNIGELMTDAAMSSTTFRSVIMDLKNSYVLTSSLRVLTQPVAVPKMSGSTIYELHVPKNALYQYSGGSVSFDLSSYLMAYVRYKDPLNTSFSQTTLSTTSDQNVLGYACAGRYNTISHSFPVTSPVQRPTNTNQRTATWGYFYPAITCSYTNTDHPGGTIYIPTLCVSYFRNPTTVSYGNLRAPGVSFGGVSSCEPLNSTPTSISAARMRYALLAAQSLEQGAMLMWADTCPNKSVLRYASGTYAQVPNIWQMWKRPHWVPFVDGMPLHVITLADATYTVNWRVGSTIQTTKTTNNFQGATLQTLEAPRDNDYSMVAGGMRYWLVQVDSIITSVANPIIYSESAWLGGEA